MAALVVDSSIVIKWFLLEPFSAEARTIRAVAQAGTLAHHAPDLIYAELGNIVWKKHTLQNLAAVDANAIINTIRALPFTTTPTAVLLDDAYRLAVTHHRTVYDALYLALSEREQCPCVTADERLVNAVAGALPRVVWLGHWSPPEPTLGTSVAGDT